MKLLVVTIPALVGALGSVVSAYVAVKIRRVEKQTNHQLTVQTEELKQLRLKVARLQNRNLLG